VAGAVPSPTVSEAAGGDDEFYAGLSLVLPDRELRVTKRCLTEDLDAPPSSTLEDVSGHPIVRSFLRERRTKTAGTRDVSDLRSGKKIWVLTQGQRWRGGTWYDEPNRIVWLVAAGHHESGSPDDFFPYCRDLDRNGRLAPAEEDYKGLFLDRDARFAAQLLIDAPLLRKAAEGADGEVRTTIGGKFGVAMAVEVIEDLREMTAAFDLRSANIQTHIPAILGALEADGTWEQVDRMPSRQLEYFEAAWSHMSMDG
jgi:hypothetical protein